MADYSFQSRKTTPTPQQKIPLKTLHRQILNMPRPLEVENTKYRSQQYYRPTFTADKPFSTGFLSSLNFNQAVPQRRSLLHLFTHFIQLCVCIFQITSLHMHVTKPIDTQPHRHYSSRGHTKNNRSFPLDRGSVLQPPDGKMHKSPQPSR